MSVVVHREAPRFEITIDRPKANAIDAAPSRRLGEAFVEFRDDPAYRVAILTGAGDRFFTAGWDLKAAAAGEPADADYGPGGFGGFPELPGLRKPIIAAVNGMAVGGGFEMVLAAELVVAAEHAEFFLPEASRGIVPDAAAIRLPRMVPPAVAAELLLTGRRLTAGEARRLGLVNAVVPGAEVMGTARELADRVAGAAPSTTAAILEIGRATAGLSLAEAYSMLRNGGIPAYDEAMASGETAEGAAAFVEGRSPSWEAP